MTDRENFAEILDEYLEALEAGSAPDREALLAEHPEFAEELQAALLGVDFVHGAAPRLAPEEDAEAQPGRSLGDYRLLRELGRGGMAVVYEAEQVSLGRHVALKVLPFTAVLDPKHLQRFKNEAMAAAHLRHPNIVPVCGVGCERGVHFYAMQYVEGRSLASAIADLKGGGAGEGPRVTPVSWTPVPSGTGDSTMPRARPPSPPEYKRRLIERVRAARTPEGLSKELEPSAQAIRNRVRQADRDAGRRSPDAAEWRGRALECLGADLAAREEALLGLVATLEEWKQDRDLAAVRACLDELPEPEREAGRSLWAAADRVLSAARAAAK